jgi:heat shock protein HtpX
MNMMRTAVLLAALTALFLLVGAALGGGPGIAIALVLAIGTNAVAYWNSDRLALAAVDAHEVDARTAPDLVGLVGELAGRAGLPMPRVYVVASDQPNAFATGRDPSHAAIAVNSGLVRALSREELAGVLSHELTHVKNRDTLTMTITATLAGAISMLAHWALFLGGRRNGAGILAGLAVAILAPLAAMIVQMAVSRGREYEADRGGALICGNPLWLAHALVKISAAAPVVPNPAAQAHPAMAHLYIVNPLAGTGIDKLFSTHPSLESRIAALQQLAQSMGVAESPAASAKAFGWAPFSDAPNWGSGAFSPDRGAAPGPSIPGPWRDAPRHDTSPDEGWVRGPWG